MTANDLLAALAAMTPEQRERKVVVRLNNGSRPCPMLPVSGTGVHHNVFWLEVDSLDAG